MRKLAAWEFVTINAYFFGLSFLWNSLHVILLPAILLLYVPDSMKNTILGLLTGAGLVIAMAVQPVAGAVSDGWRSRFGRRRPLVAIGSAGDLIFLAVLAFAGGVPGLVIGYIGLQFTSNTAHGPAQGLLPDMVPPDQLGRGSAIKSALDMLGLITASLLMGSFFRSDGSNWPVAILLIVGVLAVATLITLAGSREASRPAPAAAAPRENLRSMLAIDWSTAPGFARLIVSRFVFLAGVYGIQAFAQYFIRDTLQVADPVNLTGKLMAAIAVSLTVCAFGSGWLCDRIGRRPVHGIAAVLVAGGSLLMLGAHTAAAVLVCGVIIGAGIGIFLTANWALATDLAPQAEAGKFLGLTNLATAGAGAVSRLMGPAIDGINNAAPGNFYGYSALFIASAFFAVLGLILLLRIPERVNRGLAPTAKSADIEITSG